MSSASHAHPGDITVIPSAIRHKAVEEGYDAMRHGGLQKIQIPQASAHIETWMARKDLTMRSDRHSTGYATFFTRPVFADLDGLQFDGLEALDELRQHTVDVKAGMDIVHVGDLFCTDGRKYAKWLVDMGEAAGSEGDDQGDRTRDSFALPLSEQQNGEVVRATST